MVTGGERANRSAELLSSHGTRLCSLPSLPKRAKYLLSQTGLLICAFFNRYSRSSSSRCHTFSDGNWTMTHKLGKKRSGHAVWASPRGVLIMGGVAETRTTFKIRPGLDVDTTTELLTDNGGTTPSFNLANKVL